MKYAQLCCLVLVSSTFGTREAVAQEEFRSDPAEESNWKTPYGYGYSINVPSTGDMKEAQETSDGGVVSGVYRLLQPDGCIRTVRYTADSNGFHPVVTYDGPCQAEVPQVLPASGVVDQAGNLFGPSVPSVIAIDQSSNFGSSSASATIDQSSNFQSSAALDQSNNYGSLVTSIDQGNFGSSVGINQGNYGSSVSIDQGNFGSSAGINQGNYGSSVSIDQGNFGSSVGINQDNYGSSVGVDLGNVGSAAGAAIDQGATYGPSAPSVALNLGSNFASSSASATFEQSSNFGTSSVVEQSFNFRPSEPDTVPIVAIDQGGNYGQVPTVTEVTSLPSPVPVTIAERPVLEEKPVYSTTAAPIVYTTSKPARRPTYTRRPTTRPKYAKQVSTPAVPQYSEPSGQFPVPQYASGLLSTPAPPKVHQQYAPHSNYIAVPPKPQYGPTYSSLRPTLMRYQKPVQTAYRQLPVGGTRPAYGAPQQPTQPPRPAYGAPQQPIQPPRPAYGGVQQPQYARPPYGVRARPSPLNYRVPEPLNPGVVHLRIPTRQGNYIQAVASLHHNPSSYAAATVTASYPRYGGAYTPATTPAYRK